MATKTKRKVYSNISHEKAQEASETFATNANQLDQLVAKMNAELDAVKSKYTDRVTALKSAQEVPVAILEAYAYEQKDSWDKKSFDFLHTVIGFRTGTPKVEKTSKGFTWDGITELLKSHKLTKFIRTKEEVNKEEILALRPDNDKDKAILNQLKENCFVTVIQDETFYVTSKSEEV